MSMVHLFFMALLALWLPSCDDGILARSADPLVAARDLARDGDLQGDWAKLVDARDELQTMVDTPHGALAHYYLGYVYWRMSSMAVLVGGPPAMRPLFERALVHLEAAVAAKPDLADAHALLAMVAGSLLATDPSQAATLGPKAGQAAARASELAPANPRVMLVGAMFLVLRPPDRGGDRTKGLALWHEAIEAFERERKAKAADARLPNWGDAEAWGWLGGLHVAAGEFAEAHRAFERALALRPDFWWVDRVARPLAARPALEPGAGDRRPPQAGPRPR